MKSIAQFHINQLLHNTSIISEASISTTSKADVLISKIENSEITEQNPSHKSIVLSIGTFIDHESLSLLVSNHKIIKTWPTQDWSLLMIDSTERFAIFESNSSYHMSILDLESGIWKEDTEGHMLYFSDQGEAIIDNFHSIIHSFAGGLF